MHQLPAILEGELDPLIEPLSAHFDAERMREAAAG
jgi:protein subunit release factor A